MISQFYKWTRFNLKNVLFIKYEEIFEEPIKDKLKRFLNKKELTDFPIEKKTTKSESQKISDKILKLFEKYEKNIDYINNFVPNNFVSNNYVPSNFVQNNFNIFFNKQK